MKGNISFHIKIESIDVVNFSKDWLRRILRSEKFRLGVINYIILSDEELLDINIKFLKHNYFTDVITFSYNTKGYISGDIYISWDRLKENAKFYNVLIEDELKRIMVHGLLHLMGYDDKDIESKRKMTRKEDYYLKLGEERYFKKE